MSFCHALKLRLTMIALAFACLGVSGHAETRALLVGVNDYTEASGIPDLRGPRNDVDLMHDVLTERDVADITVLADSDGAQRPTRTAILAAFADLAARARDDDLIYIYLSGHGSRHADPEGDETDGLDEVFLPADTEKANGASQIPNAISDDEIGAAVRAIRATGADVWLVMDSCHSGTGLRNVTDRTATRQVDAATLDLKLPDTVETKPVAQNPNDEDDEGLGGYLAFYATRSNDVARELDMTEGDQDGDAGWYGLFSATLAARMQGQPAMSYRELFQAVLSDMNTSAGLGAALLQTPQWEGNMIDATVFGGEHTRGVRRFLLEGDMMQAGLVHGIQTGTLIGLVADVTDPRGQVISYAQVEEAEPRKSYLRPVAETCEPKSTALCAFNGSLPQDARFAQVELQPIDRRVRFSTPIDWATGQPLDPQGAITQRLVDAVATASEALGVSAATGQDTYDVQVVLRGNSLWFGREASVGSAPAGLEWDSTGGIPLEPYITRILRAETLAATLDRLGDSGGGFLNAPPVQINASHVSSDIAKLAKSAEGLDAGAECRAALSGGIMETPSVLADSSDLKQCDFLEFSAQGTRAGQRDVNRVQIDAQYCITVDYDLVEGDQNSRKLGHAVVCSDCPGEVTYSAGHERLYFVTSELQENAEALNLEGVIENCKVPLEATDMSFRGAANNLMTTLRTISTQGATRNIGSIGGAPKDVWVQSYRWRVLPRSEVFARDLAD